MNLDIPSSVLHLINHIQSQGDIVTSISVAGMGFVLLTWSRVRGMAEDIDLTQFRKPNWLLLPLSFFFVAFVLGYLVSSLLTGYFAEIVSKLNFSCDCEITDAQQHFEDYYYDLLQTISGIQLFSGGVGALSLSIWFVVNLFDRSKKGGIDKQVS